MWEDRWLACVIFISRPARTQCRPMGVLSIVVVIATGDAVRSLLYLFTGGACPSWHAVWYETDRWRPSHIVTNHRATRSLKIIHIASLLSENMYLQTKLQQTRTSPIQSNSTHPTQTICRLTLLLYFSGFSTGRKFHRDRFAVSRPSLKVK